MLDVGQRVGEFRLEKPIGEGPSGTVWRASPIDQTQAVALKLLRASIFPPSQAVAAYKRLVESLTVYGRLEHIYVARVLGAASDSEQKIFGVATEYSTGQPFGFSQDDGGLSLSDILEATDQLTTALQWLHAQNAIHGNLKPNNVLVEKKSGKIHVKLLDLCWSGANLGPRDDAQPARSPQSDQIQLAQMTRQAITLQNLDCPLGLMRILEKAASPYSENGLPDLSLFKTALEEFRQSLPPNVLSPIRTAPDPTLAMEAPTEDLATSEDKTPHPFEEDTPTPSADIQGFETLHLVPNLKAPAPNKSLNSPLESDAFVDLSVLRGPERSSRRKSWRIYVFAFGLSLIMSLLLVIWVTATPKPSPRKIPDAIDNPTAKFERPAPQNDSSAPLANQPKEATRTAHTSELEQTEAQHHQAECQLGIVTACLALGHLYQSQPTRADHLQNTISAFKRACALQPTKGCLPAANSLNQTAHPKLHREARRLYEKACDARISAACVQLAKMWKQGRGGRQNDRTALAFESRACRLGHKSSCAQNPNQP